MSHVSPSSPFILWNAMSPSVEKGIKRPNQRALYIIANIAFPFMLFLADVVVTLASKCCLKKKAGIGPDRHGSQVLVVQNEARRGPKANNMRVDEKTKTEQFGKDGPTATEVSVTVKDYKIWQAKGLADLKRLFSEERYEEFIDCLDRLMGEVIRLGKEESRNCIISDDLCDFLNSVVFDVSMSEKEDDFFGVKLCKARRFDLFVRLYQHRYNSEAASVYRDYQISDDMFKVGLFSFQNKEIQREIIKHEGMREIINKVCLDGFAEEDVGYKVLIDGGVYEINRGAFYYCYLCKHYFLEMRLDYLAIQKENSAKTRAQLEIAEINDLKKRHYWY